MKPTATQLVIFTCQCITLTMIIISFVRTRRSSQRFGESMARMDRLRNQNPFLPPEQQAPTRDHAPYFHRYRVRRCHNRFHPFIWFRRWSVRDSQFPNTLLTDCTRFEAEAIATLWDAAGVDARPYFITLTRQRQIELRGSGRTWDHLSFPEPDEIPRSNGELWVRNIRQFWYRLVNAVRDYVFPFDAERRANSLRFEPTFAEVHAGTRQAMVQANEERIRQIAILAEAITPPSDRLDPAALRRQAQMPVQPSAMFPFIPDTLGTWVTLDSPNIGGTVRRHLRKADSILIIEDSLDYGANYFAVGFMDPFPAVPFTHRARANHAMVSGGWTIDRSIDGGATWMTCGAVTDGTPLVSHSAPPDSIFMRTVNGLIATGQISGMPPQISGGKMTITKNEPEVFKDDHPRRGRKL